MTQLNRRHLLQGAAALPLVAAAGSVATQAKAAGHSATAGAAVYSAPLGQYKITALLDGVAPL
ncbi:twin-arginine translocation signal domain-containing protein, partial [Planktomarina temperata]|nr:twin-arginine translocation signal domain-containing protein [Planktomarina temperata]